MQLLYKNKEDNFHEQQGSQINKLENIRRDISEIVDDYFLWKSLH